jgi:hypothetical protein
MDGLAVKVKTIDGVEKSYKLTPRIIVAFEQNFGAGMPKLLETTKSRAYLLVGLEMPAS